MMTNRVLASAIGAPIDAITFDTAIFKLNTWASTRESRYVCLCNVHSVVTASQNKEFEEIVCAADMATPDGAPVAWLMRKLGHSQQKRISGPDLMWKYCEQAQGRDVSIFLYGNSEDTLALLQIKLLDAFPGLKIAGAISPPFRALTPEEDSAIVEQINASGAGIVWVSLGCPKQEQWMADHRGHINAVLLGVGAAFDYHAGTLQRAPKWMQEHSLEWFYRLASEPKRLWTRYFVTNTLFILKAGLQLTMIRFEKLGFIQKPVTNTTE